MLQRRIIFIRDVLSLNTFSSFVKGMQSTNDINSDCSVGMVFRFFVCFGFFMMGFVSQS